MTDTPAADGGPTVVRVAGPSDSGKTTCIERLVDALSTELTVGTVKSIHHDIEPDTTGTDTHRHRTAGARSVVGITPHHAFEVTPLPRPDDDGGPGDGTGPDNNGGRGGTIGLPDGASAADRAKRSALATTLERFANRGYDVVLVEGFSGTDVPTVWLGDDREPVGDVLATDETPFDDIVAAIRELADA